MPAPVPAELIEQLRASQVDGVIPASTKISNLFEIGEQVRISDGPFAGFNAVIDELPDCSIGDLDESARVRLAVNLFGRQTRGHFLLGQVEKL